MARGRHRFPPAGLSLSRLGSECCLEAAFQPLSGLSRRLQSLVLRASHLPLGECTNGARQVLQICPDRIDLIGDVVEIAARGLLRSTFVDFALAC